MNLDSFSKHALGSHGSSEDSKSSAEKVFVKSKHGGAGRRTAPAEPLEPMDIPEVQAEPVDEKMDEPEAVLTEGAWNKSETLFQEETEVSVKVALPQGKEHLTRIEAELHVRTPKGPELISRSEGHAKADGTAVFTLPVYKPNGHQGDPADYFLVFKHKIAKVFKPESLLRKVSDLALKSADHVLIPGICFAKNSSFIRPKFVSGLKALESRVKDWESKHPKGKIVIYGHADSDESDPKALSERRAESVFAFITNDASTWEKLFKTEKWGLIALQHLMLDAGDYKGKPDDEDGPATQAAFKAVQKRSGLPESGKEDSATRNAIFAAYMKGKHDIKLNADRFRKVAGNSWMGCAIHNKAKEGDKPAQENRRVAFILINESKFFPVHFPCQDGNESGCQAQCKKAGTRSNAAIKCLFYDELLREKKQDAAESDEDSQDELEILMKKSYLDAEEIGRARSLIKNKPEAQQSDYFTRLQSKVKYKNQRDNNQTGSLADRMCNLTSLAMALEYLGIKNPDPTMQFEDYLEKLRSEKDYPARTSNDSWDKLSNDLGAEMSHIDLMTSEKEKLISKLKPEIEKGRGVVISVFSVSSGKGHIVRLQSVTDAGLVVDDPFGKLNNFAQREAGGSGYTGSANSRSTDSKMGEDNLWPWNKIEETQIKYANTFHTKG